MMDSRSPSRLLPFLLALAVAAPAAAQARVEGRVTDAASDEPMPGAQVVVEGTNLGALTDADGRYVLTGVPAGTQIIVARYIGYGSARVTLSLRAGGVHQADLALRSASIALEPVVVVDDPPSVPAAVLRLFPLAAVVGALVLIPLADRRRDHWLFRLFATTAAGAAVGVLFSLLAVGGIFPAWVMQGMVLGAAVWLWRSRPGWIAGPAASDRPAGTLGGA